IPPKRGPNKVPVMFPVWSVPSVRPAIFSGVCVAIKACDIGINPVKIPIINRRKNSCSTDLANPISNTDTAKPLAEKMRIFFRPYLSPIRPQIGEKKKAVTKVIPKIQPDQLCTYDGEKSPNVSMYKEINGKTIVILAAIKKFANHIIARLRLTKEVS